MKILFRHTRVFTFLLTLLLLGGTASESYAAKVRYHILTLPFNVKNFNNSGPKYPQNIRVEALLVISDAETVGLPKEYQSPLATEFRYWANWTDPDYNYLFDYGTGAEKNSHVLDVKYYIYAKDGGSDEITNPAETEAKNYTDIYVTYDYNTTYATEQEILLDGSQDYNITVGGNKFLCFNRSRNNRLANANTGALTGEDLVSTEFVVPEAGTGTNQLGFKWSTDQYAGAHGVHMGFWFIPTPKDNALPDPYNITIMTAYTGNETYEKDPVENRYYVKPYKGSTLFSRITSNADNKGTDNKMWFDSDNDLHYKGVPGSTGINDPASANYWDKQKDEWPGYFRHDQKPLFNSVALLKHPNGGYVFVASKLNQGVGNGTYTEWAPNKNGNYPTLTNDNNNPTMYFKSLASSPIINIYKIRTYTFKIKTHGSIPGSEEYTFTTTMRWSDARLSEKIVDHIPDALKRKYCSYKAYSDDGLTNEISTFGDAVEHATVVDGKKVIWLDYTVTESFPFETLPKTGSYTDARWYTMRMNGKAEQQNIAYNSSNNFITSPTKGSTTNLHTGENSADAQVAFIGDPYELKIISRAASEAATASAGAPAVASHNRYVGCATSALDDTGLNTNKTGTFDVTTWEMVYENTDMGNFVLRQYRSLETTTTPMYIGWGSTDNKPVTYSPTASRIRVVELEKIKYTYHIVRNNAGDIAVKASDSHDIGKMLRSWIDIPEIIRSPFLNPASYTATVTYYRSIEDAMGGTNPITNAPYDDNRNIYVRYTTSLTAKTYNVQLNSEYIYTKTEDNTIYNKSSIAAVEADQNDFKWTLDYSDPYNMTIRNDGKDKYIKIASQTNDAALNWDDATNATHFIAKSGAVDGTYEVMLATGTSIDASTTYYNIGRPDVNTVKLYDNEHYLHGNATLRFLLTSTSASEITYHLIDKKNKVLLEVKSRQVAEEKPLFPPQYHSPLVKKYYYYRYDDFNIVDETYTLKESSSEIAQVSANINIYVTYDVNDLINLKSGQLYLLEYEAGETFKQEDGSDGVNSTAQKAVYPYVNGDGNFFVYGKEQYELQQEGAASTRTRWAWYVQSNIGGTKGDPYHVTIRSRQSESYPITNSSEYNAYFMTYKPDDYTEVVTTLAWPGMSSETATEYMVLGSEGQYQLVTSYPINGSRYVVDSFEQYWKTWDTIRKKVLGDEDAEEKDSDPITVPETSDGTKPANNRTYLTDEMGWHHYEKWAYAKRWNGHNNGYSSTEGTHEKKKGWETIEHWFQTVNMGQGYFNFVKTSIDPVLILLDQHGWEIMRKPLPSSPDDPEKEAKYEAIRHYNSPMVKEYAFWATAKKRTGLHQYYLLSDRVGGEEFTSTDLTELPPYGSANVLDKKGNQNDQYVTYIVKDEYAQSYDPSTNTGKEFLIEQGTKYALTSDGTTITKKNVSEVTDMKTHILNDEILKTEQWYVKPNATIDYENGYNDVVTYEWDAKTPNAYEDSKYSTLKTAVYVKETDEYKNANADGKKALTDMFGQFSFSNGFDPYNIQIQSVQAPSKYMKTNATNGQLHEGSMIGTYSDSPAISLSDNGATIHPKWYDSRNLDVTNATFMAVQDAEGNMQLMPRFDHALRMSEFGTLIEPTDANVASTYTKLYRPEVYEYHIIDNSGQEALRYKGGGDLQPQTPEWFQSQLAKDYTYHTANPCTDENMITESLDGVTLTGNNIYVRYSYDEDADVLGILKGNWLTMTLNVKNTVWNDGLKQAGEDKPDPVDNDDRTWQWKFTATPQTVPDPYAVSLYNRSTTAKTETAVNGKTKFALLNWYDGDGVDPSAYTLAVAGKNEFSYDFVNGASMDVSTAATIANEGNVKSTSCSYTAGAKIELNDDVTHAFTYMVYTNSGVLAIQASQTYDELTSNYWIPILPVAARTPLLDIEQYRYYEKSLNGTIAESDTLKNSLSTLYGLYDDIVYTHYTPYNEKETGYLVPNVKTTTGSPSHVARDSKSNDAPLGLNGSRPYNIIWYNDNMMMANGNAIGYTENNPLSSTVAYEWVFEGNDPYAIKIRNKSQDHGDYILEKNSTSTELSNSDDKFTSFMLLNREGYEYGVFAKTGKKDVMLSGYGNTLVTDDHNVETTTDNPTKFIIFALSTNKVIYHLMIKNIGTPIRIPYKGEETSKALVENYEIKSSGTTMRDLLSRDNTGGEETHTPGDKYQLGETLRSIGSRIGSSQGLFSNPLNNDVIYCYDAGHVSLGDKLEVPSDFYRPNVNYDFYIGGVYASDGTAGTGTVATEVTNMNNKYKGVKVDGLGEDSELLDKIIFVNIVYSFMGGLDTNSGSDFVTNVSQNKWYTFETNDATPMLAEYTGSLQTKSGYATHYTNDYLWTPVGDPYGFKMYNRYAYKNSINQVMTTTAGDPSESDDVSLGDDNANAVYELLATNTTSPGYFIVHPVVNLTGLQYYLNNNTGTGAMTLSTTPTEWTFGLSEDVMRPYYLAAGYVGGLNAKGKEAYEAAVAETDPSTMLNKLMNLQDVVYNHDKADNDADNYIVHYTPGYYRLHNQPGSSGISTPRYASGYTHKIEANSDGIPMHFYEVEDYGIKNPTFGDLESGQYTVSAATRGDIPLVTVANDPASIFHFSGLAGANPTSTICTQGLNVIGNKMGTGEGTVFKIIDIGAGVVALQKNETNGNFLKYDQTEKKFDLKFNSTASTVESARWCMQPVQKYATARDGEMELRVNTNNGGDNYYYTTFCAPFDVLMTNERDVAYVIPPGEWPTLAPPTTTKGNLYPKEIGQYNTGDYDKNNQFIPAGTPVIIRTSNPIGYVTMALPNSNPSPSPVSCLFTGKYLEQMLTQGADDVYVFGRDLGTYTKASNYSTTGQFTTVSPSPSTGIGFYINANPNKEANENKASWTRNNKYVLHNKIYYRAGSSGAGTRGVQFVPVVFGAEAAATDVQGVKDYSEGMLRPGNVYNLQGRCVATEEMVKDGTWKNNLTPGVYIMNGKKIIVK